MSTTRLTIRSTPLLGAVIGVLLAGCSADGGATVADDAVPAAASSTPGGTPSASPSETPSASPSESPSPTPTETPTWTAELIPYAGGESIGYEVFSPADVAGMEGAPTSFKRFIARKIRRMAAESTCEAPSEVIVQLLRTDGFATGGVNDCGGYQALWVQVDGVWQEVDGTQEMEGCAVLERYHVPSELVDGRCYDYDAQEEREYHRA